VLFGVVVDGGLLLELLEHAHELRQDGVVAAAHEVREGAAEVRRGLLEMVVRYASEHVVHLMRPDAVDEVVDCTKLLPIVTSAETLKSRGQTGLVAKILFSVLVLVLVLKVWARSHLGLQAKSVASKSKMWYRSRF